MSNPVAVAQTAIFLWEGMMQELVPGGSYRMLTPQQQARYDKHTDGIGQDGLADSVAMIAEALEKEWDKKWADKWDDGVYHYEIIEPLGKWLADQDLSGLQYGKKDAVLDPILRHYNETMAVLVVTNTLTSR